MHSTQTKLGIIAGASAAGGAAVVLVILILVGLLIVILVRNANSRLEKSQGSSKPTVDSGAILDTRKGVEKNLIPVEMNAAYEVTTQENVAYIAAVKSSAYDYEDYVYNYI